ncbi:allergen Tha p 1-like [Aricia agestis]|uniref:allergen Tha p 1-like n=1 Tax=Aricia agestis TaxID=91739 RepID=UPI001C201B4F|nr:allergen Tha p 1-like [Aricia agestis]
MKTIVFLACTLAVGVAAPADTYNPEFEKFNVKEIIENDRLLKNYGNCFGNKGPCTPEGTDIKKLIPDALKTNCAKCSPKQRQLIREVIHAFQRKQPALWESISNEHDPKGEYRESFKKFIEATD